MLKMSAISGMPSDFGAAYRLLVHRYGEASLCLRSMVACGLRRHA